MIVLIIDTDKYNVEVISTFMTDPLNISCDDFCIQSLIILSESPPLSDSCW